MILVDVVSNVSSGVRSAVVQDVENFMQHTEVTVRSGSEDVADKMAFCGLYGVSCV